MVARAIFVSWLKGKAEESRSLRREICRAKDPSLVMSKRQSVRLEIRSALLARAFLLGKPRKSLEASYPFGMDWYVALTLLRWELDPTLSRYGEMKIEFTEINSKVLEVRRWLAT